MIHLATAPIKAKNCKAQLALNEEFLALPFRASINVFNFNETDVFKPLVLEGHRNDITALLFGLTSENEDVLVSASSDYIIQWKCNAIRFASAQNGHKVKGQVIFNSPGFVSFICLQSITDHLAACVDKSIYIYHTKNKKHLATLEGHDSQVSGAEFSPFYDSTLISISHDRTFKIWGLSSMTLLFQSGIISSSAFISISCNPFNNSVAFGTADGIIRVFDLSVNSGFKQLHQIDIQKLLQHYKYANKQIKRNSIVENPKVINANKSMVISNSESGGNHEDSGGDDDEESEVGTSILNLHFLNHQSSKKQINNQKDIRKILDFSRIVLLIVTNGAIIKLDFDNFEIISCFNLTDEILSFTSTNYMIGVISNATISRTFTNDHKRK